MDTVSPEKRSWVMSRVRGKNTRPEMVVRSLLHALGYRFRLHRKDLPGNPDIILPKYRVVIFVHGCFWHQHNCRHGQRLPSSNQAYWLTKLSKNRGRDIQNTAKLTGLGWAVLIVWECMLRDIAKLEKNLRDFIGNTPRCSTNIKQQK